MHPGNLTIPAHGLMRRQHVWDTLRPDLAPLYHPHLRARRGRLALPVFGPHRLAPGGTAARPESDTRNHAAAAGSHCLSGEHRKAPAVGGSDAWPIRLPGIGPHTPRRVPRRPTTRPGDGVAKTKLRLSAGICKIGPFYATFFILLTAM